MKKLVLVGLAAIALAACGNDNQETNNNNNNNNDKVTTERKDASSEIDESKKEQEENKDVKEINADITDDELITAKLNTISKSYDDMYSSDVIKANFDITNNTDKTIVVMTENLSIDGQMVGDEMGFLNTTISAGKSSNDDMVLTNYDNGELPELKGELDTTMQVLDEETYETLGEYQVTVDLD